MKSLNEAMWQAFDGSISTPEEVQKHLGSQHDQKTHGRRSGGRNSTRWTTDELKELGEKHKLREDFWRAVAATGAGAYGELLPKVQKRLEEWGTDLEKGWEAMSSIRPDTDYYTRESGASDSEKIEMLSANIIMAWNNSTSSKWSKTFVDAAQDAISTTYGLDLGEGWKQINPAEESMYNLLSKDGKDIYKAIALSFYDETQRILRSQRVEKLRLWRATSLYDLPEDFQVQQIDVVEKPLTSWSRDSANVAQFTNRYSYILHDFVPREYIFSIPTPWDGFNSPGVHNESEVVVLGRPHEVDVMSITGLGEFVPRLAVSEIDKILSGDPEYVEKSKAIINIDDTVENQDWLRQNVSKHLAGSQYDHDQQSHGGGQGSTQSKLVSEIIDGFKGQVTPCQTASGSERQCINVEYKFRAWLEENHPEVAYRSHYVRGAKPEVVSPDRLMPLSGGFTYDTGEILRDQNHNIPAIGIPKDGKTQWFTIDWTYRQFQPESEWPLVEEGTVATERWDEATVFNERGPLKQ